MKKLAFTLLTLCSLSLSGFAQKTAKAITLNTENIQKTVVGNWIVQSIMPNDDGILIKDISIKGAGYGEVMKKKEDGTQAPVICKIYPQNNSELLFSDAEGYRVAYKVVSLSSSEMVLSKGKTILTYIKK